MRVFLSLLHDFHRLSSVLRVNPGCRYPCRTHAWPAPLAGRCTTPSHTLAAPKMFLSPPVSPILPPPINSSPFHRLGARRATRATTNTWSAHALTTHILCRARSTPWHLYRRTSTRTTWRRSRAAALVTPPRRAHPRFPTPPPRHRLPSLPPNRLPPSIPLGRMVRRRRGPSSWRRALPRARRSERKERWRWTEERQKRRGKTASS